MGVRPRERCRWERGGGAAAGAHSLLLRAGRHARRSGALQALGHRLEHPPGALLLHLSDLELPLPVRHLLLQVLHLGGQVDVVHHLRTVRVLCLDLLDPVALLGALPSLLDALHVVAEPGEDRLALADLLPEPLPLGHELCESVLHVVQRLDCVPGAELHLEEFVVPLLDLLEVLLVLDLELVKVDDVEHLAHLLLLLQLLLHLGDLHLDRGVLHLELLDGDLLHPEAVLHEPQHLLRHRLPRSGVLRAYDDVPLELVGLLLRLGYAHVHRLHGALQLVNLALRALLRVVDALVHVVDLGAGNLGLLLKREADLFL
mmetsp:Transcript_37447/g.89014  ORF Transcript_37447/g.89014 Transcript_37447/m.89014 type:complete len:316 (+) Transcript_37447:298-1245(+)